MTKQKAYLEAFPRHEELPMSEPFKIFEAGWNAALAQPAQGDEYKFKPIKMTKDDVAVMNRTPAPVDIEAEKEAGKQYPMCPRCGHTMSNTKEDGLVCRKCLFRCTVDYLVGYWDRPRLTSKEPGKHGRLVYCKKCACHSFCGGLGKGCIHGNGERCEKEPCIITYSRLHSGQAEKKGE